MGKVDGVNPIYSDNLKHASRLFAQNVMYMYLFNNSMSHGCSPKSFVVCYSFVTTQKFKMRS